MKVGLNAGTQTINQEVSFPRPAVWKDTHGLEELLDKYETLQDQLRGRQAIGLPEGVKPIMSNAVSILRLKKLGDSHQDTTNPEPVSNPAGTGS